MAAPDTTHDWQHSAACKGMDGELWFPIGDSPAAHIQTEEAKAVCYRCPAMEACGAWALKTGQIHGVWGGLDEAERRTILRRRSRQRQLPAAPLGDERTLIARDLADRHADGESINAIAKTTGRTWDLVKTLISEGQAAS